MRTVLTRYTGIFALGMLAAPLLYFLLAPWLGALVGAIAYPGFVLAWLAEVVPRGRP
jgi:hypothetical protein